MTAARVQVRAAGAGAGAGAGAEAGAGIGPWAPGRARRAAPGRPRPAAARAWTAPRAGGRRPSTPSRSSSGRGPSPPSPRAAGRAGRRRAGVGGRGGIGGRPRLHATRGRGMGRGERLVAHGWTLCKRDALCSTNRALSCSRRPAGSSSAGCRSRLPVPTARSSGSRRAGCAGPTMSSTPVRSIRDVPPFVPGHETVGHRRGRRARGGRPLGGRGRRPGGRRGVPVVPGRARRAVAGAYQRCERHGLRDMYGCIPVDHARRVSGAGTPSTSTSAPDTIVHPVPDGLDPVVATLFNPIGAGIRWGVDRARTAPGEVVAVLGPGVRGFAACAAVKEAGAGFVMVTGRGSATPAASRPRPAFGADLAVDVAADDPGPRAAERATGAGWPTSCVDVTAKAPAALGAGDRAWRAPAAPWWSPAPAATPMSPGSRPTLLVVQGAPRDRRPRRRRPTPTAPRSTCWPPVATRSPTCPAASPGSTVPSRPRAHHGRRGRHRRRPSTASSCPPDLLDEGVEQRLLAGSVAAVSSGCHCAPTIQASPSSSMPSTMPSGARCRSPAARRRAGRRPDGGATSTRPPGRAHRVGDSASRASRSRSCSSRRLRRRACRGPSSRRGR